MAHESRLPSPAPARTPQSSSPPFCRVERRGPDGATRCFVVHTRSPRFVVEFRHDPVPAEGLREGKRRSRPVIHRVCVPNGWAGDYLRCARQLGAAAEFVAATDDPAR